MNDVVWALTTNAASLCADRIADHPPSADIALADPKQCDHRAKNNLFSSRAETMFRNNIV
jgi:hypothetical protein